MQPIGSHQNLVIQEFNNEFIVIAEDSTNTDLITDLSTIDCFYHVYGERKDAVSDRGRLKESNVINLPDYNPNNLVHEDTYHCSVTTNWIKQNLVIQSSLIMNLLSLQRIQN